MRGAKKLAFEAFDRGERPSQANIKGLKKATLYRYFQEWKRARGILPLPPGGANVPAVVAAPGEVAREVGPAEGLRAHFEEFKAKQEFEKKKGDLRERVDGLLGKLAAVVEEYPQSGVSIADWEDRSGRLADQLADFCLARLEGVSSEAELAALAGIVDETDKAMRGLVEEYRQKVAEQERLRKRRELDTSRRLLTETLNLPFVPPFVRRAAVDQLLVKNGREAEIVSKAAMDWWNSSINEAIRGGPAGRRELWRRFSRRLKEEGWEFLCGHARHFDMRERQLFQQYGWRPGLPAPS